MKITTCLALVSLASFAACLEADDPDIGESTAAVEPGFCSGVCRDNTPCEQPCRVGNEEMTCWDYGRCFQLSDPDRDGIISFDDNCWRDYNPDQANCDGDNLGDACDSQSGNWVRESTVEGDYIRNEGYDPDEGRWCEIVHRRRDLYRDVSSCGGGTRVSCFIQFVARKTGFDCGPYELLPPCQ